MHAVRLMMHCHLPGVMQTGSGQSLVTRALVISLLNRIKVCWHDANPPDTSKQVSVMLAPNLVAAFGNALVHGFYLHYTICAAGCAACKVMHFMHCQNAPVLQTL